MSSSEAAKCLLRELVRCKCATNSSCCFWVAFWSTFMIVDFVIGCGDPPLLFYYLLCRVIYINSPLCLYIEIITIAHFAFFWLKSSKPLLLIFLFWSSYFLIDKNYCKVFLFYF